MAASRFLFALLLVAGCGGRTLADLEPVSDGGVTIDLGIDDDSSTSDDAITGDDAIVITDGELPPDPDDASTPPSDGGGPIATDAGPAAPRITCGMSSCDGTTQECCVAPSPSGASSTCVTRGTCDRGVALTCTSGASCPAGQTCCLRVGPDGGGAACSSMCGGRDSYRLCTSDAECPMGQRCRNTTIGIRVCFGAGPGGPG